MKFTPSKLDQALAEKTGSDSYNINFSQLCSVEEYYHAVTELTGLALGDTGGSRVAAQVLLSSYNGTNWQLDITDLGILDNAFYNNAIAVIIGRINLQIEPHQCIEDGGKVFNELSEQWQRYNIKNRHKPTCYDCHGAGEVYTDQYGNDTKACNRCNGTGLLDK